MTKTKKYLLIGGIILDVLITLFLFIISIIMIVRRGQYTDADIQVLKDKDFIFALMANTWLMLGTVVIPLFLLLAANIVGLVFYLKSGEKKPVSVNELTDEQKEALKQELLKDLKDKKEE